MLGAAALGSAGGEARLLASGDRERAEALAGELGPGPGPDGAWAEARAGVARGEVAAAGRAGHLLLRGGGAGAFPGALRLLEMAAGGGDAGAQTSLGVLRATGLLPDGGSGGLGGEVFGLPDVPRAVLQYYFGAVGNSTAAQMALGWRHQHGEGVPSSCQAAVLYYHPVAERVIEETRVGGGFPKAEKVRLIDTLDVGYNPGKEKDMVQFYQYSADMGNADAQTAVGQLFNTGTAVMGKDHAKALHYFEQAANQGDADAMAHLGHMHANGMGVPQSNETALVYFREAALKGHSNAMYGLGYLHLAGYGVKKDYEEALKYFTQAGELGHFEAQFHLGVMYLNGWGIRKADTTQAAFHFQMAMQGGHVLATYNMAVMRLRGLGSPTNCKGALSLLKKVAEKGLWSSVLSDAHAELKAGNERGALWMYLTAAEMGYEVGQSNAAWMLERGMGLPDGWGKFEAARLAKSMYRRSALQGNAGSLLSLGDLYFDGKGMGEPDVPMALKLYGRVTSMTPQTAAARAFFNLGLLHHLGKGLPQDLHLAKRYYDLAKSTDKEAEFPVALAQRALSLQKWWARAEPRVRAYVAAFRSLLGMGSPKETGASTEGRTPAPEGGVGVGAPWSISVSIDTDTALLCALTLLLAALMHVIHVRNLQRRRN